MQKKKLLNLISEDFLKKEDLSFKEYLYYIVSSAFIGCFDKGLIKDTFDIENSLISKDFTLELSRNLIFKKRIKDILLKISDVNKVAYNSFFVTNESGKTREVTTFKSLDYEEAFGESHSLLKELRFWFLISDEVLTGREKGEKSIFLDSKVTRSKKNINNIKPVHYTYKRLFGYTKKIANSDVSISFTPFTINSKVLNFLEENKKLDKKVYGLKFDISSFFNSIDSDFINQDPLGENYKVIDKIYKRVQSKTIRRSKRKVDETKELFYLILESLVFSYNGRLLTGMSYSSHLASFLTFHIDFKIRELINLYSCESIYLRYVDDILLLFNSGIDLKVLLLKIEKILNSNSIFIKYDKTELIHNSSFNYLGISYNLKDSWSSRVSGKYINKVKQELWDYFIKEESFQPDRDKSLRGKMIHIKNSCISYKELLDITFNFKVFISKVEEKVLEKDGENSRALFLKEVLFLLTGQPIKKVIPQ